MARLLPTQARVARGVLLDARLALFHRQDGWLAVADLHFGFEISQRAAGRLMPMWGMETTRARLLRLLDDYKPRRLVIVGDLVHDKAGAAVARDLLNDIAQSCDVNLIAGNHDRGLERKIDLLPSLRLGRFYFHHGHCAELETDAIQIIGHHHPAGVLRDGAGLRLKFPAFVQQQRCWILPAFSPWAAGANWSHDNGDRFWLCTPSRVLCLGTPDVAIV